MSIVNLNASCYCPKENIELGFGCEFDSTGHSIELIGTDWIDEGLSDSFWENVSLFDSSIERVRTICRNNKGISDRQALIEVFGRFVLCCESSGKELDFEFNIDEAMYSLLENLL